VKIDLPDEAVEAIAERAAELVLETIAVRSALPERMTVPEAAEYMRCGRQRIYDLRSAGALTRLSDGRRALVLRSELDAHLLDVDELSRARRRRRVA